MFKICNTFILFTSYIRIMQSYDATQHMALREQQLSFEWPNFRKNPENSVTWKIAVISLKF